MKAIKEYILSSTATAHLANEVDETLSHYGWFSSARTIRSHIDGKADTMAAAIATCRAASWLDLANVDVDLLTLLSSEDIIERFLQEGTHRIVAEDGEPDVEIDMTAKLSTDDDLASEELAEIYLAQGLRDKAIATYRKLILLNSEKSVYFAELIEKIKTNN